MSVSQNEDITFGGGDQLWLHTGNGNDAELARRLASRVKAKVQAGLFSWEDVRNLRDLEVRCVKGALSVSKTRLEMLRRLCQVWDIDFRVAEISSHRKLVGPAIVAGKRVVYRILKVLLKDMIRQQRDFNATAISLLADLTNQEAQTPAPQEDRDDK